MLKLGRSVHNLGKKDLYRLLRWGPSAVADLVGEYFEAELPASHAIAEPWHLWDFLWTPVSREQFGSIASRRGRRAPGGAGSICSGGHGSDYPGDGLPRRFKPARKSAPARKLPKSE